MYTIILLKMKNRDSFKRYQFIYLNAKLREEIGICFWDEWKKECGGGLDVILRELNARIKEYSNWKLILYDERDKDEKLDEETSKFLRIFTGKDVSTEDRYKVDGAFPAQLFYIQSKEKEYTPLVTISSYCCIDREREFGENFRMFWFGMESGNARMRNLSEFKLYCALLSLAMGEIPYTFMESGYLYELDIKVNWEIFGQYVAMFDNRMEWIRECLEEERESLKQRLRAVDPFPDVEFRKVSLGEEMPTKKNCGRILTFREMLRCDDVESILEQNREQLEEQMFYPKGVLHEESRRIHRMVEGLKGTENFLDEMGKELLGKRIRETIGDMCAQKDAQLEQQEFEENIRETEKLIKNQATRLMNKKERRRVLVVFGFLELFIVEPYLIQYVFLVKEYRMLLFCLPAALATFALVFGGYYCYLWIMHGISWRGYKTKTYGHLSKYRSSKKRYLENILTLILKLQYFEKMGREQRQLFHKWVQNREMLVCHSRMLENGKLGLEPLLHLWGGEGVKGYAGEERLGIDFTKEPREEDYYQIPLHRESRMEINYSGYMTKTAYPFILRLMIRKSICNNPGGDFNG